MEFPTICKKIAQTLHDNGFQAYIVGGFVRDYVRGVQSNDIDMTTDAKVEQLCAIFSHEKLILTGAKYGTVTILIDDEKVELTTFRVDGDYVDFRRPSYVHFTTSLKEDLSRRDFTINAMAFDVINNKLIDYFGGIQDIRHKIIRTVGSPLHRFEEDALRILRAYRMMVTFNYTMDKETEAACHRTMDNLEYVSKERINKELIKIMSTNYVGKPTLLYQCKECLRCWFDVEQLKETSDMVSNYNGTDYRIVLSIMMKDYSIVDVTETLTTLKYTNQAIQHVTKLVKYHSLPLLDKINIKKMMKEDIIDDLIVMKEAIDNKEYTITKQLLKEISDNNEIYTISQLHINGNDLLRMNIPPSKQIKEVLQQCLDAVMKNEIQNDHHQLLQYVKKNRAI